MGPPWPSHTITNPRGRATGWTSRRAGAACMQMRIAHLSPPHSRTSNDGRMTPDAALKQGAQSRVPLPAAAHECRVQGRQEREATHTPEDAASALLPPPPPLPDRDTSSMHAHVHQFRVQHNMPTATGRLVSCMDGPGPVVFSACPGCSPAQRSVQSDKHKQTTCSPPTHMPVPSTPVPSTGRLKALGMLPEGSSSSGCSSTHARKEPRVQRQRTWVTCTPAVQRERGLPGRCRLRARLGPTATCHTACVPHSHHLQELQAAQQLPCLITAAGTQRTSWHKQ